MTKSTPNILEELFRICADTGGAQEAIEKTLRHEAWAFGGIPSESAENDILPARLAELALMAKEAWVCSQGSKSSFQGGLEKRLERVAWASRLLSLHFGSKASSIRHLTVSR
jgi:hypothetical protein